MDRIGENILVLPVILILYLHYTLFPSKSHIKYFDLKAPTPRPENNPPYPQKIYINHICELCKFGRKKYLC